MCCSFQTTYYQHSTYLILKLLYCNRYMYINFRTLKKLCVLIVLSTLNYSFIVSYSYLDKVRKLRLQKIQNNCWKFLKYPISRYERLPQRSLALRWLRNSLSVFFCNASGWFILDLMMILIVRSSSSLSLPSYCVTLFRRSFSYNVGIKY